MNVDTLNDRLAEAARYAVVSRLMSVLRHDVAGAMQPGRMLLMVLEKRLQNAEPDLQAIATTAASVSVLTKKATASCMGALGWVAPAEDANVGLRSFVDEAIGLLALELSVNAHTLVNSIEDESASAPRNFLRSVLMGALLAFCDQHVEGGALQVSFKPQRSNSSPAGELDIRVQAGTAATTPALHEVVRKYRLIEWADVEAMAQASGVHMARGEGWLTLGLREG
jgi:hypothetical protein